MNKIPYIVTIKEKRQYRLDLKGQRNAEVDIEEWIQDKLQNGHQPDRLDELPLPDCITSIDFNEEDESFREFEVESDQGADPNFDRLDKAWTKFLDRNVHSSNKNGLCLDVDIPKASFWCWYFDYSADGSQYVLRIDELDCRGEKIAPEAHAKMQFIATTFMNTWVITEECK